MRFLNERRAILVHRHALLGYTFTLVIAIALQALPVQAQDFIWANQMGGDDSDYAFAVALEGSDYVYTVGRFKDAADFDPGEGEIQLTSEGGWDIFVSKMDSDGNYIWAKQMGGEGNDYALGVAIDSNGNVYTTGLFSGDADFNLADASEGDVSSNGTDDMFVCKLDSDGNFIWVRSFGGSGSDAANSIAIDSGDNVYIAGRFYDEVDFDPGASEAILTSDGSDDIFVSKLDSDGGFVWAKKMGGSGSDGALSVAVDDNDNVFTTGDFKGTADFNPADGVEEWITSDISYSNVFVSKLDSDGGFLWAGKMGGHGLSQGRAIAVTSNGDVVTTGYFTGMADFDPSSGSQEMTSNGNSDIFVAKLENDGSFVWARQMGGSGPVSANGNAISVDSGANVFTTGYFQGEVDFDPAVGTDELLTASSRDIFVSKLDAGGNFVWAKQMGGDDDDIGEALAADDDGNVYTTGGFSETADFDPGSESFNLSTPAGGSYVYDIFVSKLGPPDSDGDGVLNADDICPGTTIPEGTPSISLGTNRWALVDGDVSFDTTASNGTGPSRAYSTADTGGCSCEQIVGELGLGTGFLNFGCTTGVMDRWVVSVPVP